MIEILVPGEDMDYSEVSEDQEMSKDQARRRRLFLGCQRPSWSNEKINM